VTWFARMTEVRAKRGRQPEGRMKAIVAATVAFIFLLSACAGTTVRTRVEVVEQLAKRAEYNGAMRCAPRELAMAKAHIHMANTDLDQGELSAAQHHLAIAEPNAQAAFSLSPIDKCSDVPLPPEDPDTDGDGIPDSRDACRLEPEDKDGYLDEDGCPELDNDADGIPDSLDHCPNDPEDPDGFEDEDGCPDKDNDQDGLLDVDDQCPNTPGPRTGEKPGCPGLVVITPKEIKITQQIQFDFDKDTIKPVSFPILDAVKDVLVDNPAIKLEIQGHTDNFGTADYNQKLSSRRAEAVKKYLIKKGIDANRLTSKGYGFDQPLVPNDTKENRAINRRVQFIRTESGGPP
jgi:OmpA-OmpF porin, OOP family